MATYAERDYCLDRFAVNASIEVGSVSQKLPTCRTDGEVDPIVRRGEWERSLVAIVAGSYHAVALSGCVEDAAVEDGG